MKSEKIFMRTKVNNLLSSLPLTQIFYTIRY
nr:MAG TPA: hypothetical protein [Caudoviricetes sp.]